MNVLKNDSGATTADQSRRNHRMLETLEQLLDTPDKERTKPAYSALLIRLHSLTTEELYATLVEVYDL